MQGILIFAAAVIIGPLLVRLLVARLDRAANAKAATRL